MNIAIIGSRGYPVVYSGYETFVRELAERLVRHGVGVTVYCHRNLFRERPRQVNGIRYLHGHEFGGTNPSLLQALASGCAVCALDTVFNRETLLGGEYGFYFTKEPGSLAEWIGAMEAQPGLLHPFRDKARERIRDNYSWEKIVVQYSRLFAELTGCPVD